MPFYRSAVTARLFWLWSAWLLILTFSRPSAIAACTPVPPTPWFREQLTLEPFPLPAGITIKTTATTIQIGNTSTTPLYLLGMRPDEREDVVHPYALPAELVPLHKVVAGASFDWRRDFDPHTPVPTIGWFPSYDTPSETINLSVFQDRIFSWHATVLALEPRNRIGDKRPANPDLPRPQQMILTLVYGTEVLRVPMMISYLASSEYDPESVSKARHACQGAVGGELWSIVNTLGMLVVFIGVGCSPVIVLAAFLDRRRRRK
jgi:hypothetical protein